MARNRIIKPEFWADAKVGRLSFGARLLYIAMWNFADDYGTISASPRRLLGDAFENDESVTLENVQGWLTEIETQGQIRKYTANEKDWYEIVHFKDHQRISHKSTRVNPKPPVQLSGDSPATLRQDTGPNVNVNDNGNGNGNGCNEQQQDAPPASKPEKPLALHDQAYILMFAQIAALFGEADLSPSHNRIDVLKKAVKNVSIGGFDRILEAANNLARSPAPDCMKRYDWLLHRFDYAEHITEFLTAKNNTRPRPRKYTPVPDDWRPDADATTTAQ
ncbi:MAG TPA: hypothetical protein PKZ83_17530 [bacterium]|nr:hypothetical protein [bacterium]HQJ66436.1 hypothetical protein [bacterium]